MNTRPARLTVAIVLTMLVSVPISWPAAAQTPPSPTTPQDESQRTADPAAVDFPALAWRFETGGSIFGPPLLADDAVLVHSLDGHLYAVEAAIGEQRWRLKVDAPFFDVTVAEDTAYVNDTGGTLRAIEIATGDERWQREAAGSEEISVFSPPTVVNGVVYVDDIEGETGNVYALDAESGEEIWQAQTGPMQEYVLPLAEETVAVHDIDGIAWFLDAATGKVRSTYETGGVVFDTPEIRDGVAFIGVDAGRFDAVDIATGRAGWSIELPSAGSTPALVLGIAGDAVVVGVGDRLYALDTADGATRWEMTTGLGSPTVAEAIVYATDPERRLGAFDAATGRQLWVSDRIVSGVEVVDDDLLIANLDHNFLAIDRAGGQGLWRVRTGGIVSNSVAVTDDAIYLGSVDHVLYAFDRQGGAAMPGEFADLAPAPEPESLMSVRLEPLPATPAFAGIWRASVSAGDGGTLPPFAGAGAALVRGGSLTSPDGFTPTSAFGTGTDAPSVTDGESFLLPERAELAVANDGETAVELLIVGILPSEADLPAADGGGGLRWEFIGGGTVVPLPGEGAFVGLARTTMDAGTAMLPSLSVWPDLLAVEEGAVEVAGGDNQTAVAVAAADGTVLPVGTTRFVRAGAEASVSLLVLEIYGESFGPLAAGGCGTRCLSPRRT